MPQFGVSAARGLIAHKDAPARIARPRKRPVAQPPKRPIPGCGKASILARPPRGARKIRWQVGTRRWLPSRWACGSESECLGPCPPPAMLLSWFYVDVERGAAKSTGFRRVFGGGWPPSQEAVTIPDTRSEVCNFMIRSGFSLWGRARMKCASRPGAGATQFRSSAKSFLSILLSIVFVFPTGIALPTPAAAAKDKKVKQDPALKGLPITELSADEAILHALNRLAYGPRPGDVERVRQMGLAKWIEQQ